QVLDLFHQEIIFSLLPGLLLQKFFHQAADFMHKPFFCCFFLCHILKLLQCHKKSCICLRKQICEENLPAVQVSCHICQFSLAGLYQAFPGTFFISFASQKQFLPVS